MRDDECTMSVHRAVASKSDDVATMRADEGCCKQERRCSDDERKASARLLQE